MIKKILLTLILTATIAGAQTFTNVMIPFSTNIAAGVVQSLNVTATNALNQNSPVASQLVGLTNSQTISGAKTATNAANLFRGKFIGGSIANASGGDWSFVGGGHANNASGGDAFIGSGTGNTNATTSDGVIVGGGYNFVGDKDGGFGGIDAFIGAGFGNHVIGSESSIVSGANNYNEGIDSFIGAGSKNIITNFPSGAAILGGVSNIVSASKAFAIGSHLQNSTPNTVDIGTVNANKLTVSGIGTTLRGIINIDGSADITGSLTADSGTFNSLVGEGDAIVGIGESGSVERIALGSGLSLSGGTLSATGGGGGSFISNSNGIGTNTTFSGFVVVPEPSATNHPATMNFVEMQLQDALAGLLPSSGGTASDLTATNLIVLESLTVPEPAATNHVATKLYVDSIALGNFSHSTNIPAFGTWVTNGTRRAFLNVEVYLLAYASLDDAIILLEIEGAVTNSWRAFVKFTEVDAGNSHHFSDVLDPGARWRLVNVSGLGSEEIRKVKVSQW